MADKYGHDWAAIDWGYGWAPRYTMRFCCRCNVDSDSPRSLESCRPEKAPSYPSADKKGE